ncbi:MAG TPA: tyrosine-type recombinase/integrase [Microvirga sp.]|nr:tyrosine-type recombinase/integrase [Microvirga sp.]
MASSRATGTVSWLIRQYCDSRHWKRLAASTKEIGRLNLKAVEAKWGKTPLKIAGDPKSRPVFLTWHDRLAENHPRAADAKLAALARVLSWGRDFGHIKHNPLATFERAYRSDRSELIWLPEHVEAFEAVASLDLTRAMALALHTGQRQGDLLRLTWAAYDGAGIALKQGKTGRGVYIPCTKALKEALDEWPRRSTQILTRADGTPWTRDAFKQAWRDAYAASEMPDDLHFHDLRGTAVTMLAEAGCTVPEIAAITGHSQAHAQKILDRYLARTRALAESAIAKLDEHRRNKKGAQAANRIAN